MMNRRIRVFRPTLESLECRIELSTITVFAHPVMYPKGFQGPLPPGSHISADLMPVGPPGLPPDTPPGMTLMSTSLTSIGGGVLSNVLAGGNEQIKSIVYSIQGGAIDGPSYVWTDRKSVV